MLETLPRGKYSRAARTTTKFQTLSPVYDEAFVFAETRLEVRELRASVWDETTGSGHERLGQIVVPLEAIFHNMFRGSGGGGKGGRPVDENGSKTRAPARARVCFFVRGQCNAP